eukprot:2014803-Heterocapsa_arctica.AAC.1
MLAVGLVEHAADLLQAGAVAGALGVEAGELPEDCVIGAEVGRPAEVEVALDPVVQPPALLRGEGEGSLKFLAA